MEKIKLLKYMIFEKLEQKIKLFENLILLKEIYQNWENYFKNIREKFNLNCPDFCNQCCDTDIKNIQSTIFEMLPAAILIFEEIFENQNNYKNFFKKNFENINLFLFEKNTNLNPNLNNSLERFPDLERCLFYNKTENNWGCSIYEIRPSICRLFGFSFKKDKNDKLIFSPCKVLKEKNSNKYLLSKNTIEKKYPIYDTFYQNILNLSPNLTNKLFNINIAFLKAFEIVYLKFNYYNFEKIS